MKIALAQTDIMWEDKKANLDIAETFIKRAAEEKVKLILFPEMSLTGFTMNVEVHGEYYETSSKNMNNDKSHWNFNRTLDAIKQLSIKYSINIGIGYIEKELEESKGKNKYAVISALGEVISNYTKIHPFTFGTESKYYCGGDKISYFNIDDFKLSTFICYDLRFPEIFQIASREAELITVAANWPKARINHWVDLLKARAIENQCYIAGVNRVGHGYGIEYNGNSLIIDPLGNVIGNCLEGVEGLIIAELDVDLVHNLRKDFPLKKDRRESLYRELAGEIIESIH
ncbi:putative amidohydrolase [Clostridium punense]|uniref:Amidohydrolase n=1 Tax=Clostridium punense TaxID=1054297 RepID=A0ABS4K2I4_9CLOT|nr:MULTISPECIES: nitrilase-related carbon-nitrogen hydrolase [Clostridium]EQB89370.1 hypothetical protein M918_20520 [Clostridium sp. BL8]MBP2021998.1 putative amidohydrolase [Clostridium punense]